MFNSVCELLVKQFTVSLGVIVILLLNFMEAFSVCVEVRCWIYRVGSSKECVCFTCDLSMHLSAPSIVFIYLCVCRRRMRA